MAKHSKKKKPKHVGSNGRTEASRKTERGRNGSYPAARDHASSTDKAAAAEETAGIAAEAAAVVSDGDAASGAKADSTAFASQLSSQASDSANKDAVIKADGENASEGDSGSAGSAKSDGKDALKTADSNGGSGKADSKNDSKEANAKSDSKSANIKSDSKDSDSASADKKKSDPGKTEEIGKPAKGGKHAAASAPDDKKKAAKGRKTKGKHSAPPADKREHPVIQSVPMPGASEQEDRERAEKRRRRLKRAGIGVGFAAAICLIAYLGGALFFATHYLPNTTVAGLDISLKSPDEMSSLLDESVNEYSMKVIGNGLNFTVTSDEADISADSSTAADAVLKTTNIWAWPVLIFSDRDLTSELSNAISADSLSDVVQEEVDKINNSENATLPVDAHVAYNSKTHVFEVVGETMGTMLNFDEVMNQVVTGVINLQPKVTILSDALVQPAVFSNDKRLSTAADAANEMIKANVEVTMEGFVVTKVNPDVSSTWVTFTPDIEAVFSDEALAAWAQDVADMCNTVGSERTYTRPDGKQITVSGGVYGWEVDSSGLAEKIVEAVRSGENASIDIPVIQGGTGFNGLGGQDWGNRYVDVDLSEQYARFYGDDSSIIWEAPIVSGKPSNGHATPPGVWWVNHKASPSKLIGEMKDGKPEYETTVQYWMPFQGNAIGFHDATWQPYFGGSLYLSNGSHGCINLSYSAAQSLYGILDEGDVVVVHY